MSKIQDYFGLPAPSEWKTTKLKGPYTGPCPDPTRLVGIEIELENCVDPSSMVVPGMTHHEDGSLRNMGREFITKPMAYPTVEYILPQFFIKNKINETNISERCSVHVHVNCCDLTFDHIASIALLYQIYEKLLFKYVGEERDKSIFCVPWSETNITSNILCDGFWLEAPRRWQKYTALNLLPLREYGTIEFRHMPGTYQVEKIFNWINILLSFFAIANKFPRKVLEEKFLALNNNSQYRVSLEEVFTHWSPLLNFPDYEKDIESGVLAAKYSLLANYRKTLKKEEGPYKELDLNEIIGHQRPFGMPQPEEPVRMGIVGQRIELEDRFRAIVENMERLENQRNAREPR